MIYRGQGGGGMFGGMYGPQGGGGWGGQDVAWQPRGGGYRYDAGPQRTGGMFAPPPQTGGGFQHAPQMSDEFAAGNDVMPTMQPQTGETSLPQQPPAPTDGGRFGFGPYGVQDRQSGEFYGGPRYKRYGTPPRWQNPPSAPQGFGPQGFTGNEWKGGQQSPQGVMAPGFNVNQQADPQPQLPGAPGPQQQSLEQFQSTLGNAGAYTSGQVSDMYQKSIQPQAVAAQSAPNGIYNGNIGPGGTQNPYPGNPNPFPSNWGAQTFNFDPRAMAGKNVGQDMAWYYGQDSVGRGVNAQGNAVPSFPGAADGYNRSRPWFGR